MRDRLCDVERRVVWIVADSLRRRASVTVDLGTGRRYEKLDGNSMEELRNIDESDISIIFASETNIIVAQSEIDLSRSSRDEALNINRII